MDTVTPEQRSDIMRRIRSKNTKPELALRRLLRELGIRYRLHGALPGSPDIVIRKQKKAIFIHGCFFHQHSCKNGRMPKSNQEFWRQKFERNRERDARNLADLERLGWSALVVWECELKDEIGVRDRLIQFLH